MPRHLRNSAGASDGAGSPNSCIARFGPPSPLNHLWSLAVEEQFYLLWPWLLLLGVPFVPERKRPLVVRPRLAGVVLALALASAAEMAVLYHPTFDPSRLYDGTDTRASGTALRKSPPTSRSVVGGEPAPLPLAAGDPEVSGC